MINLKILAICILLIVSFSSNKGNAQDERMLEDDFTFEGALVAVESLKGAVFTLRDVFTDILEEDNTTKLIIEGQEFQIVVSGKRLSAIDKQELDWSKLNQININHILLLKGYILKSETEKARLKYQLMLKDGDAKSSLGKAQAEYAASMKRFEEFMISSRWVD